MKRLVSAVVVIIMLLICSSYAKGSALDGSVWQYDPYDDQERIAFSGDGIYIWIDEDIAYPDPGYWSKHTTVYLNDTIVGTKFCANVFPIPIAFGLGYSGQANILTATGILYHWLLIPSIKIKADSMELVDTNFFPYQSAIYSAEVYDLNNIKDEALRKKIYSDLERKFLKSCED
jgi:hypothetical protein